jgi:hypothetical protein
MARRRKPRTVPLRQHAQLQPPEGFEVPSSISRTSDGDLVIMWASPAGNEALSSSTSQPGWASFPDSTTARPVEAQVRIQGPDVLRTVRLNEHRIAHPKVQLLPDDRLLVVGTRCYWREGRAEENALVYDGNGQPVLSGTVGDGISHVYATPRGRIWIGYFDEGIFGNYGWGAPTGPEPVGSSGIVRFTSELVADWRFPQDSPFGGIADVYAMSGDGEDLWSCYYTDWPIVRISSDSDDSVTGWRNTVAGGSVLVVGSNLTAIAGGYREDRDRVVLLRLDDDAVAEVAQGRLILPSGEAIPPDAHWLGGKHELSIVTGSFWYKLDLETLTSSLGK